MRTYDIPYVSNGVPQIYPVIKLEDMTLDEIKKKYIRNCGKANGDLSVCSKCQAPCPEGKRAIQLVANSIYNDPPIPLYGGKTLIERAREENIKRKAEEQKKEQEKTKEIEIKKTSDGRTYIKDWYKLAMAEEDPVAWIMKTFNISRSKAKHKIYGWEFAHPEDKPKEHILKKNEPASAPSNASEPAQTEKAERPETVRMSSPETIEAKLEILLKQQEVHKQNMQKYQKLYKDEEAKYNEIKQKTDILCSAMDIMSALNT